MTDPSSLAILTRRVNALDAPTADADRREGTHPDIVRFVRTMDRRTETAAPPARAADADAIVGSSQLLARLAEQAPHIAVGPVDRSLQH